MVSVEYLPRDQGALLLSASEDCTARLWTLNGQFIGMFGQVSRVVQLIADGTLNNVLHKLIVTIFLCHTEKIVER